MKYHIEFFKQETGELHKEEYEAIDWREAASYAFGLQHTLRERKGGIWIFYQLKLLP